MRRRERVLTIVWSVACWAALLFAPPWVTVALMVSGLWWLTRNDDDDNR